MRSFCDEMIDERLLSAIASYFCSSWKHFIPPIVDQLLILCVAVAIIVSAYSTQCTTGYNPSRLGCDVLRSYCIVFWYDTFQP